MNGEQAKGLRDFIVATLENETTTTKKVIQNIPDDKKSYKPDPKSKSAHELAWHIVTADVWFLDSIINGKFEMTGSEPPAPATVKEVVAFYDQNLQVILPKLKAMSGDDLAKVISFFGMQMPNVVYLNFMVNHSIHHRGQLSTYLRPMGSKVPSIYGGSADEPFQMEGAGA
jgi:uncharacterized damage-inducible protein DinB